jgi:hypothetical protein
MGWGSGYDAKSITDLLDTETFKMVVDVHRNTRGLGYPGNVPGSNWLGWDEDAPKSRKVVVQSGGKLEPMGWMEMRFTPVNGSDDWLASRREALVEHRPAPILIEHHASAQPEESSNTPVSSSFVAPIVELPQKPLIEVFTGTPDPGDSFEGVIFGVEDGTVLVEIPGLDPDTQAYGVLTTQDNPLLGIVRDGQSLRCQVVSVEEDAAKKGYYRVRCQLI